MQLITPKAFHPIFLFLVGVSGVFCALYGSLVLASLFVAYVLYGWYMPKCLEYLANQIDVRLVETTRAFRDDELAIPFALENRARFPLGKVTVSGLLGDQVRIDGAGSQFWRHHLFVGKNQIVPFEIDVIAAHRGTIRIQSFDVMISDPFHTMTVYLTLPIQQLGHVFPDFAPASVEWNERQIPGETVDRSSPFTDRSSFHSVVPYAGDAKTIYWSAYAKTSELYSYQYDRVRNHDYAVIIDGLSGDGLSLRSDFEKLLSRGATIIRELEKQGASYSLWISMVNRDGQWYHVPSGKGKEQFLRTMECLARLSEYDLPLERRYFMKRLQRAVPSTTAAIHLGHRQKEVSA
ncbi:MULTISPECIES: DUF58 domain-containing protein [unclassified Exiguobacterium]|uniref:DUF58 domain-containing protein n=1 Tax=unclassified Exiguobacterium TaxID=2644629 RepID=UPI000B5904D9|nr:MULTISPECIES: DUF58 domain-containing protein [unclassified Exiguobacterium]ASI35488.1 hypothetical protein A0126_07910 [Exiguobacterium sp. N4-1P]ASI37497.1 hypothetical protein A0126_18175 [Exiguobacterium sp. N4-1P]